VTLTKSPYGLFLHELRTQCRRRGSYQIPARSPMPSKSAGVQPELVQPSRTARACLFVCETNRVPLWPGTKAQGVVRCACSCDCTNAHSSAFFHNLCECKL